MAKISLHKNQCNLDLGARRGSRGLTEESIYNYTESQNVS